MGEGRATASARMVCPSLLPTEAHMGKKKKPLYVWQEENKPQEPPKRKEIAEAFSKAKSKRPLIRSSHKGGSK